MKQIEVTIMGHTYLLGCPDGAEPTLQEAVARVDQEMCSIRDAGKIKARERIAVLAALNLAYLLSQRTQNTQADLNYVDRSFMPTLGLPDIDSLVRRIDQALEKGGQLL